MGACKSNEEGDGIMKDPKFTTRKKIIYILAFLVCVVMMVLIHRGQRNIIKFYDLDKGEYVDIDIDSREYLRGNYTSLHTAAFGYLVDYGFVSYSNRVNNGYSYEEPKCEETTYHGSTSYPIRFYDDVTGNYGYVDKDGNFVVEPIYFYALNFDENGLACVRWEDSNQNNMTGVIDQYGNHILDNEKDIDYIIMIPGYKWIIVGYSGDLKGSKYWCYSIDGLQGQKIAKDDFYDILASRMTFCNYWGLINYVYDESQVDFMLDEIGFGGK